MASSQTEVLNLALTELGADLITSIDDPTKAALLAKANWLIILDAVSRAYPWNCLIARKILAPDSVKPIDEWEYQFTLPPTCLRVLSTDLPKEEWVIEGRCLLANTNVVRLKYIERVTDVTKWDGMFTLAYAARLASLLAYPLVQSTTLKDLMGEAYRTRVREARTIDAQEGQQQQLDESEWIEARS
jgi:hypothetical protein